MQGSREKREYVLMRKVSLEQPKFDHKTWLEQVGAPTRWPLYITALPIDVT